MVTIPQSHPRYESLMTRERLVEAWRAGLVAPEGLLAHGRGEAYDYLLGEASPPFALAAARVAAAHLLLARHPVLSVNGNAAALAPSELAALQESSGARVEVNLFHRTEERVERLIGHLERHGCRDVLGRDATARIPGLEHERGKVTPDGIHSADVVLVPLEDGDRCEALRAMGKTVIVVDLNPLSRTARKGSVTLVDNVTRAIPAVTRSVDEFRKTAASRKDLEDAVAAYDNDANLRAALRFIAERLTGLA